MNKDLGILIDDYLDDVARGVELLKELTEGKPPLRAWRDNDIPQKGLLTSGVEYELHGVGCLLSYKDYDVDFDFGPDDRADGFDLWRLTQYVSERGGKYNMYTKSNNLKQDFEQAVKEGTISKSTHQYCNLYFYS
ncbi:hypothetical protein A7985_06870 [Pseudoalteromonas luteoviolacea]|uniref:DUF6896 domain-containing protein n=1 Tax=Pseudoalteromonas luteoviolacea TaxID=43657 RepID=A0A1C0TWF3_9GAMM|nr:hypothetical protein [Pseudoalteromonas luteoviolacea]OCQ23658.1 hypothetical protein A7985_06870 [Pseudoalteromonas luteoviolacea]